MASIESVIIEVTDTKAASRFYTDALGLDSQTVRIRPTDAPTTGFRGFTLSLVVSQPSTVDTLVDAALRADAATMKPVAKSLWGYGGVLHAPDGTIVTVASSAKKDTGPASRQIDEIVLQLGVADVAASRQFYVDQGLVVAKSYGRRYVNFDSGPVTLALYKRSALAKTAGIAPEGTGSRRIVVTSDAAPFTDLDGFVWETAVPSAGAS